VDCHARDIINTNYALGIVEIVQLVETMKEYYFPTFGAWASAQESHRVGGHLQD